MKIVMSHFIRFLKDWTLPVAIAVGTVCYLVFQSVSALDAAGTVLAPVFDFLLPLFVFLTLFITFCKIDFHQMRPHRWHCGVLVAQLILVGVVTGVCLMTGDEGDGEFPCKLLFEALLTCIIGPSAAAAPVVVGKLGGNISTMTAFTLLSAFVSALLIPLVFPLLEQTVHADFLSAFLIILRMVFVVLLLPLLLGWVVQHRAPSLARRIASIPNLGFYTWAVSLAITAGITVKNIIHSEATPVLLAAIAAASLLLCFVQFFIGRAIGRRLSGKRHESGSGDSQSPDKTSYEIVINAAQALFQKNTGLSIWVSYMYLSPVASIGAGCYVLWQNIINSAEIWAYNNGKADLLSSSPRES